MVVYSNPYNEESDAEVRNHEIIAFEKLHSTIPGTSDYLDDEEEDEEEDVNQIFDLNDLLV